MTCDCGSKMRCTYTLPIPSYKDIRYRAYKCLLCHGTKRTLEVPEAAVNSEEGKAALLVAKKIHCRIGSARKRALTGS